MVIEKTKNHIIIVNSFPLETLGSCKLKLQFGCLEDVTVVTTVIVVTYLNHPVILGRKFMEKHEIILNFRKGIIQSNFGCIEMGRKK